MVKYPSGLAYVVFTETDLWFLKGLKRGYRHCAVFVQCGDSFVFMDPRLTGVDIRVCAGASSVYDLAGLKDTTVQAARIIQRTDRQIVPAIFTCVTIVKRVLGIKAWWVLTPYQLNKYIMKNRQV